MVNRMDDDFRAEWECQRQVVAFYLAFDDGDYAAMAGTFTDDGSWTRSGARVPKNELVEVLSKRPSTVHVRHVITNMLFSRRDDGSFQGLFYVTAYRARPGDVAAQPFLLVKVDCVMRQEEGAWRFADKVSTRLMNFEREDGR